MIVGRWMTKSPVVTEPDEKLESVRQKMDRGKFRRLPVVENGKLVGILSDRDLRQHAGSLERVKVSGVMTSEVVTVPSRTLLDRAAHLMVKHKVGGLPVVDEGKLVGIITATDLLRAFAEVLGAAEEGVSRIDLALSGDPAEPAMIAQLVAGESGEILGMGTYKEEPKEGRGQVMYLRVRSDDARKVADMLTDKNYTVVAIHQ